ncbi:hypothetical protein [Alkalicoccobacillus gibsonii]|uniref:hypothetical protein n=1 Tax=Alkalicoccobacillus gibsonii TaxID=79881 RepID=UPI0035136DD9
MTVAYPIIEGKYRFRGGWRDIPTQLLDLVVGRGYDITPSGENDYLIRGSSKLIMVNEEQFKKYFEPYIDYEADPIDVTTKDEARIETEPIDTHTLDSKCDTQPSLDNSDNEQMTLF